MRRLRSLGVVGVIGISLFTGCAGSEKKPAQTAKTDDHAAHEGHGAGPGSGQATVASWAKGALILPDLGNHHRTVSTQNKEAQVYFDQGLRLIYGFNHDESTRSFAKASELDPTCAMCFWGVAITLGPNYNVPMLPDRAGVAWEALQKAQALSSKASPVEQALIAALAKRYKGAEPLPPPAMQPFNEAYAAAMREVAKKYASDDDVQVLFAESLMDADPWKLWTLDGKPGRYTAEILGTLDVVLKRAPQHPGANHYYIHSIEASQTPEKGVVMADRLAALMPGAGHVVHMPAHIYQRVGRYSDAAETNRKAIAVDEQYMKRTTPPGYYPMYVSHNAGFLSYAASMLGRGEEALSSARAAAKSVPPPMVDMMPGMDFFVSEHLFAMVRFAKWDELVAEPRPSAKYQVMTALWLHGHGMGLASKGKLDEAMKDHAELVALRDKIPADMRAGNTPAQDVAALAAKILEARIAEMGKKPTALALWAEAVALEDKTAYSEPADWYYPVRHFYGAALLVANKAKDAEAVYKADLKRNPGNGWALAGLVAAQKAQKKTQDAAATQKELDKAWKNADVKITTSIL
jgi:tetratricopeptide (TPR) repeat protein